MKILEIVTSLSSGGAERFVVDLSNELSKNKEVVLVTLKDDTKGTYGFYKKEVSEKIKYINLGLGDGKHLSYLWKVYKIIKKENPQIVHLHSVTQYCALAIILLHTRIKFFQTVHNDIKRIGNILYYKLAFKVFGRLNWLKFITISQTNHIDLGNYYPQCVNTLIYNGRSPQQATDLYPQVKQEVNLLKRSDNTIVFIHIARCSAQKNQSLLIRTFNRLIENGVDASLLVIGNDFDSQEGLKLQENACNQIHFLGTRTNIIDYLLCSDIFVLSSIYEGMPISLIEAIQAGKAILSTPVCGVVDVIKSGTNGVLSDDFEDDSYYKAMFEVSIHKDKYISTAFSMRNQFTIQETALQYLQWFNK